jgi:hypothetical protein
MNDQVFISRVVTVTLALILIGVVAAMLYGLFDQHVDNKEIFTIIGPAFQTIVGTFVGFLGGRALERKS